jgi:tRNA A-37 threonylcarbamoyl transferase component Bud32/predicted nucleotidyltransferase
MYSISERELEILKRCIRKVANGRTVIAACIYGSRAAGYARPDSDIDILVVLENYPFLLKYVYLREPEMEVSALIVDKKSLERDAKSGFLGEFVAGRLLHIYEPIAGPDLLFGIECLYKRRVILEETQGIINSASTLSTEILFPLEYIAFSKIKRRTLLYPSATYSYYRTYNTANKQNLEFALDGYRRALNDIVNQDASLFVIRDNLLQISEKRVFVAKGKIHLKMTKRLLQEFNSYFVQTYAGRRIWHLAVKEAESKIKRHIKQQIRLPDFMSSPRTVYWQLPEGRLIVDKKDWLSELVRILGKYSISKKRLGDINSKTVLYIIKHDFGEHKIAVKKLSNSKTIKWMALSLWTAPVKRFKADPLFRLGSEYKALRYIRSLGLHTPTIEAVVLDRKLLVTQFIEGRTLSDIIKDYLRGKDDNNTDWISRAGAEVARIHIDGSSLGNIKPKNIVVNNNGLYFTDVEQFMIKCGDQAWDLAQFISWGLKNTRNADMATEVVREFLRGYLKVAGNGNVTKLAKSRRYIESFYPLLMPSVAYAIKKEIKNSI